MKLAQITALTLGLGFMATAAAADCVIGVNCDPVTVAPPGQAPVHFVVSCLTGTAAGGYMKVSCDDSRAQRINSRGQTTICFLGDDGRVGYDIPEAVSVGAAYYNYKLPDGTDVPKWLGWGR